MTTTPSLHTRAADMLERGVYTEADVAAIIAELRAAAALDELVRENERLGLYDEGKPVAHLFTDHWGKLRVSQLFPHEDGAFPVYAAPQSVGDAQPVALSGNMESHAMQVAKVIAGIFNYDKNSHYVSIIQCAVHDAMRNAIAAPSPAQPTSDAQPVAWRYRDYVSGCWFVSAEPYPAGSIAGESMPLYLAPAPAQSRQPLSEWIACDDRLPDNNTHCFVVGPRFNDYRRGQYTAEALFIDGKFFSHDEGDDLYTPSHWFPIPTLPAAPERAITGEKP